MSLDKEGEILVISKKKSNTTDAFTTKKVCLKCQKEKQISEYYISYSELHADKKVPVCKICLAEMFDIEKPQDSLKEILRQIDKPFLFDLFETSLVENPENIFGKYMKNIGMRQYKGLTWKDSENSSSNNAMISTSNINSISPITSQDEQNKEDVLRMVGYDPFEIEAEIDKKNLYNKLVDFLDESTLEDSFKLPAVIEIVKTYNQIDKINSAISLILSNPTTLAQNAGNIKSMSDSKKGMLSSILALAKDNGISVNHNNNKSKGTGTLSGIMKQLNEKGIKSSEINVFDVETCEGMKQVADISNKSIIEQLMLNENDYSEMIKDQKELIDSLRRKNNELEEENRIIKIKLKNHGL
ncbi:hypothetical protein [Paenibacillus odorifer]|uniref:hypothetical protein n=1 Tax=Paenibacillus odorifer TaxID=189426 RepID=UPI00211709D2|nr:hypothetical protein [Paenibacillus odorifer]